MIGAGTLWVQESCIGKVPAFCRGENTMTEKTKNLICSVAFLAIGALIYFEATQIKVIMAKDLGSGFFPKVVGITMMLMALLELILTLVMSHKNEQPAEKEDNDKKGMLLTVACMVGYAALFDTLGFIISSAAYLFLQITVLSNEKNRKLPLFAIISVATSVAIYGIFVYLIGMPLPTGILEF